MTRWPIFVEQAHARGLAIEAWVNPYRVRLNDTMPPGELAADNPALLHEGWALEANGGLYYDPALPEVQDMVVQGVTEIVQNYDVDGIRSTTTFIPPQTKRSTRRVTRGTAGDRTWPNGGAPTSTRWCRRYTPPSRR